MSTTARPPWLTACCSNPAHSARISGSPSVRSIPTIWNASGASPFWRKRRQFCGTTCASTSSIPPVTPISAARSSAFSTWWTARWCWWMRPRAPCRKPSSSSPRRSKSASSRLWSSTRSIGRTPARTRWPTKSSTCSPRLMPAKNSSISRSSMVRQSRAGWPPIRPVRPTRAWCRCSISLSGTSDRRWSRTAHSACSARSWSRTLISAASSLAASRQAR